MTKRSCLRHGLSFAVLAALMCMLMIWNLNSGSVSLSVREIGRVLFRRAGEETAQRIVWDIRFPRILAAAILGGGLSVSGFLLQTFFANPIAGPFVHLHNWSMGSFSGMSWENIRVMAVVTFLALVLVFLLAKPIGAYQMGEVYAQNMGVNILRFRVELILLSSLLSACVTAFAGPISFVGIAVPHLVKGLFGTAKPLLLIPGCFLGGAVFCLFCDLIARTVFAPTELGISSVTAVFGAPIVIYMMVRGRRNMQ